MPRPRTQPAAPPHTVAAGHRGWAVINLHEFAEQLPAVDLLRDLRRHLPGGMFYFPALKLGRILPEDPLSSYVFVMAGKTDRRLLKVERSRYVDRVLCAPHSRHVARLTDKELHRMVSPRIASLKAGQTVSIQAGDWAGLEGTVVTVLKARVRVRVQLWSRQEDVTLPRADVQLS